MESAGDHQLLLRLVCRGTGAVGGFAGGEAAAPGIMDDEERDLIVCVMQLSNLRSGGISRFRLTLLNRCRIVRLLILFRVVIKFDCYSCVC